jgi:hypothetical protein
MITISIKVYMSKPEERGCFVIMPDGSCKKVIYFHDNLNIIMEDGIIDIAAAKGQGHYDLIMKGIERSLDLVLGEDETTKNHCKQILEEPNDVSVIHKVQMASKNQELCHFLCVHGSKLGFDELK